MSRTTVDHPAGSARRTSIGEARAALRRIEEWLAHLERRGVTETGVYVTAWLHTSDESEYSSAVESMTALAHPDDIESQKGGEIAPPSTLAKMSPEADVYVFAPAEVCERVQVGTRLVEKPDPDAPMVEVEEPVYEYRCTDGIGGTA